MMRRSLPIAGPDGVAPLHRPDERHAPTANVIDAASRREFLLMLGGLTAASLPSCRRNEESFTSPVQRLESSLLGTPLHYATALSQLDTAFGVIVESCDGHPTKIEGNPRHPESLGATTAQLQATLFDFYDPDRSHGPTLANKVRTWNDALQMLDATRERIKEDEGASFAIVTDAHRSPSLRGQLELLRRKLPKMQLVRYAPLDSQEARCGIGMVYGQAYEALYDWSSAERVLTLDADPLGLEGSPLRSAQAWAKKRSSNGGASQLLFAIESSLSLTGCVADYRWACESHEIGNLVARLVALLERRRILAVPEGFPDIFEAIDCESDPWGRRLNLIADELASNPGQSIIQIGARQPATLHALVHWLNHALGNVNRTVTFAEVFDRDSDSGPIGLRNLAQDLTTGKVKTLLILAGNPAFSAPGDIDFAGAIRRAELSIHLGTHIDETAQLCHWHLNLAHELETFGDITARDGTASIMQPLTMPLWGGKAAIEVVARLRGDLRTPLELVQDTWRAQFGEAGFALRWRDALIQGTCGSVAAATVATPAILELAPLLDPSVFLPLEGLEVTFAPDAASYDGRFANNAWLQELPHPITKTTWGNPVWISSELAKTHGIRDGQVVRIECAGRSLELPALVVPGQASRTLSLFVGQGHKTIGRHGNSVGVNVYPLQTSEQRWHLRVDKLTVTDRLIAIPRTQIQFSQLDRQLARELSNVATISGPGPAHTNVSARPAPVRRACQPQAWGMTIDLSRCLGCASCMLACQIENNIPFVGLNGILRGRSMHWLRVDRYFTGEEEQTSTIAQPVPCQHCENAPCESVCPVGATAHSPEGLNDMVYNRCVGSRYCANNCPYEVRRFNYYEYNAELTDIEKLRLNPEVSVRSRGVMEKCSFCVQRIQSARIAEKKRGSSCIADGTIVTACEQACPTRAITFGDLADPVSRVYEGSRSYRAYRMLDELNVEPRVFYLAKHRHSKVGSENL